MKENRTVVWIGEVLWDILPDGKKIGGGSGQFRISRITIRAAEPCSQCNRRWCSWTGDNRHIPGQRAEQPHFHSTLSNRNSTSRTRHGRHPTIYHKGGRRMGLHSIHAGTGSIGPQHLRSMFRFTCTEEHGIPQHHQSLHWHNAEGQRHSNCFRCQSQAEFLQRRCLGAVYDAVQCSENQWRGTPDSLSDIRHSWVGSGEPMPGIVEPLQSEDYHSDLRSKRQLHFHARRHVVLADATSESSWHRRSRRLLHCRLYCKHLKRLASSRSPQKGRGCFRLRLHSKRCNARPSRRIPHM